MSFIIKQTMAQGGRFDGCIKMDKSGVYTDADYVGKMCATHEAATIMMNRIKSVHPHYRMHVMEYKRGMR